MSRPQPALKSALLLFLALVCGFLIGASCGAVTGLIYSIILAIIMLVHGTAMRADVGMSAFATLYFMILLAVPGAIIGTLIGLCAALIQLFCAARHRRRAVVASGAIVVFLVCWHWNGLGNFMLVALASLWGAVCAWLIDWVLGRATRTTEAVN